ncbi:hypothetical protein [Pyxidicoccus sp. MSG2]|uniref:hypothetical protein n=1 Tax=Pyxidicoccus sp. MSG2 TaxID=2996790 RepID=UPI00226FD4B5|nr:hypothetical protein [Pyxidicoccus sp. MSG2]MCY1014549.1 hypothetical protein [Pyxidicoccus sp. MSG2]
MRWTRRVCAQALLALSLWGCGDSEQPPGPPPEPDPLELTSYPLELNPDLLKADEEGVYILGTTHPSNPEPGPQPIQQALYRTSTREPQESLTRLAETNASDFVVGPSHLYFIELGQLVETPQGPQRQGALSRVPKAGGAKERITESLELFAPISSAMVLVGPHVYWLNRAPNQSSQALYRTTADSTGPIERLATAPGTSTLNLMANATHLYWLAVRFEPQTTPRTWNGLFRVPLSSPTASPEMVLTWPHDVRLNVSDGSRNPVALTPAGIFAGLGDPGNATLALLPLEPGAGATSPTILEPLPDDITDMQAHRGTLYFSTRLGRGFRSRALNGTESTQQLTSHHPSSMAVNDAGIFFTDGRSIWRKKL